MSETQEVTEQPTRAFWPSDYRRFASTVRDVRKREGDEAADALVTAVTAVFVNDSEQFDQAMFAAGTHQVPPHYGQLASALKRSRYARGGYEAKPAELQERVDAMTAALSGYFTAADPRFDQAKFATSTEVPAPAEHDFSEAGCGPDEDCL